MVEYLENQNSAPYWWWLFPSRGFTLKDQTDLSAPLFGDATLLNILSVQTILESKPWADAEQQNHVIKTALDTLPGQSSDALIAVRVILKNPDDKQETDLAEKRALARAREIASLLAALVIIDKAPKMTCGLTCDLPNDHYQMFGFSARKAEAKMQLRLTSLYHTPLKGVELLSSELTQLLTKPGYASLCRAVIDKNDPRLGRTRETLSRALVRLYHAIHSDAGAQLLGAFTSLEILLDGTQATLAQRLQSLTGIVGINKETAKSITDARNGYVHRGLEITDDMAKSAVSMAIYVCFAFARVADEFPNLNPNEDDVRKLLDLRSHISINPNLYSFASNHTAFRQYLVDLLPTPEEIEADRRVWEEFQALNERWKLSMKDTEIDECL